MLALLAQLVSPPLQPGPVRLPGTTAPWPTLPPARVPPPAVAPVPTAQPVRRSQMPAVRGFIPYGLGDLQRLLAPCQAIADPADRLEACAAALRTRLFSDGYINTRVLPRLDPPSGSLVVVPGRIETVEVVSSSPRLQRRLIRLLKPLQGTVLNLESLTTTLTQVQQLPGIGLLKSNLNRVAEDSSRALLLVTVEPGAEPLRGEGEFSNDGNSGSGQFRGLVTVAKSSAFLEGDSLLAFAELNADGDPEIGSTNGSLSYALPLLDPLRLTTAIGASRRLVVDGEDEHPRVTFRQLQLYNQLDYTLQETLTGRLWAFAGLSLNRNDAFKGGKLVPAVVGGADQGWLRSGFLRLGLGVDRSIGPVGVNASLYGLQGFGLWNTASQQRELRFLGIVPAQARAIGGQVAGRWQAGDRWQLNLQGAAQLAFAPLTEPMGFSLGSDNGLRGLPGQVVSGDSGLQGSFELSVLLWRDQRDAFQLVPFIGAGQVWIQSAEAATGESVSAAGLLMRWLRGTHGELELGWVHQLQSGTNPFWNRWVLGSGVYTRALYRF